MFWKNEKKNIPDKNCSVNFKECIDREVELELSEARKEVEKRRKIEEAKRIAESPDWIEVEGYKAVNFDMTAFCGKEKYILGETKVYSLPISPCERGYHFGKTLKDVINYYPPRRGTRYFKVKGLVPALKYINAKDEVCVRPKDCGQFAYERAALRYFKMSYDNSYDKPNRNDPEYRSMEWKYVAKEITFLEEIPLEVIAKTENPFNPIIETKEEYYSTISFMDLKKLALQKWLKEATGTFSEGFCSYVFKKEITKAVYQKDSNYSFSAILDVYICFIQALAAVKDEQVTQDMRVVLFLQFLGE